MTNLQTSPRHVYEDVYCQRGEIENRIKELKSGLAIDRTSCSRFFANQLRVFLTAAAFALLQEIRLAASGTSLARAQATTLRETLLKIGVIVSASVRRLVFRFPDAFAYRDEWRRVALALGAARIASTVWLVTSPYQHPRHARGEPRRRLFAKWPPASQRLR